MSPSVSFSFFRQKNARKFLLHKHSSENGIYEMSASASQFYDRFVDDSSLPVFSLYYYPIIFISFFSYKLNSTHRLFHGNFVLDNPVPKKLLDMCPNRNDREFTHMRYSAATCDPNDFKDSGFTLRQVHYDPPRRTELFIVMTMYNEEEELFCRTMHGVIKNIAHLCKRDRSKTWGKEGWKKVVVCIVSDGRGKINSRTLSVIAAMGAYQEGVAKVSFDDILGAEVTIYLLCFFFFRPR